MLAVKPLIYTSSDTLHRCDGTKPDFVLYKYRFITESNLYSSTASGIGLKSFSDQHPTLFINNNQEKRFSPGCFMSRRLSYVTCTSSIKENVVLQLLAERWLRRSIPLLYLSAEYEAKARLKLS